MIRRLLALLAVLVLLAACGDARPTTEGGYVAGQEGLTIIEPADRAAAPQVSGPSLLHEGQTLTLADHAGKVIVLNVWGSWCAPCRAEAADLADTARENPEVAFVGINTRDLDRGPALAFMRSFNVEYDSIYDPRGQVLLEFSGVLSPNGIPTTLVIDKEGRVAARVVGIVDRTTLTGLIDDIGQGT